MQRFALNLYFVIIVLYSFSAVDAVAQTPAELEKANKMFDQALNDFNEKRYDAAIKNYSEYIKIRPNVGAGWFNRGLSYYYKSQNDPDEATYRLAAADVSEAIKLDAKTPDYWFVRGGIYSQLMAVDFERSRDQAIADFTSAIRLDPRFAAAYRERAVVYERINKNDEAFADLNTSIKLDPTNAVAFYTRAKIFGFRKQYAAARSDAQAALKLSPDYEYAKIYLDYINNEERKASVVAQKPQPTPSATRPTTTQSATSSATSDLNQAFQLASAAEVARDHRQTVAHTTRVLGLLPMSGPTQPREDLMLSVFMDALEMRARAYSALGDNPKSDADFELAAKATMDATVRYMNAATAALDRDKGSSGAGLIMASLESAKAVIYCTSGLKAAKEWVDAVDRTRPNVRIDSFKAVLTMAGVREICVQAHIMYAGDQAGQAILRVGNREKHYSDALETLSKALAMMPNYVATYRERAKIHRRFGRADLAAADEQKVRELESAKSRPN